MRLDSGTLSPLLKRMEAPGSWAAPATRPTSGACSWPSLQRAATRLAAVEEVPRTIAARSGLSRAQLAELRRTLDQLTATLETRGD